MRRQRILRALDDYVFRHSHRDRGPDRRREARVHLEGIRDGRGPDWYFSPCRWQDKCVAMLVDAIRQGADPAQSRELVRSLLAYIDEQFRRLEDATRDYAEFRRDDLPLWFDGDVPTRFERTCLLLARLARERSGRG